MGADDEIGFLGHESSKLTEKPPKLDGSNDGLFLNDSEPLFKKLRESERNRMMKQREAVAHEPKPQQEKETNSY